MALVVLLGWAAVPGRAQPGERTNATPATVDGDPQDTRLKLAVTLLHAHRYDEAIAEFQKVIASDPDRRDARIGLARAYFWSERPTDALEPLRPLMAHEPDAEVVTLWNEIVAASGNTLAALEAMQQSIDASPDSMELVQSKADLLVGAGCYGPAIKLLRDLVEKHPESGELALDLAHAHFTGDRYPESIALCRAHVQDAGRLGQRARVDLARSLIKSRQIINADEVLRAIIKDDPTEPRAYLGLLTIEALTTGGESTDPADQAQRKRWLDALAEDRLHGQIGEIDSVREWFFVLVGELASRGLTEERGSLAIGLADLLATGEKTPAMDMAREVLRQYAEDGPAGVDPDVDAFVEATAAGNVKRSPVQEVCSLLLTIYAGEELVRVCDAALEHEPGQAAVQLLRAEGLSITAAYDDAIEAYEAILEKLPQCTKARRGLARTFSWQRAFNQAEEAYRALIERNPDDMALRREAVRSLGWDKQLRDSLDGYDEGLELLGDADAEKSWGQRLQLERDAKRAFWWTRTRGSIEQYTALIEDEPTNLEARFDLAQVYTRVRHWEEAAAQYEAILNIDARHRRARDALYKNSVYHEPQITVETEWLREEGRGELVDIDTWRLTETFKQEIALRTDLSIVNTQRWHKFEKFRGGTLNEYETRARLDHRFTPYTWGHLSAGWVRIDDTDDQRRFVGDAALTHELADWLAATVGIEREPWRRNRTTFAQGIDECRLYTRLFSDIDPWTDAWIEYGHSWLEGGKIRLRRRERPTITEQNRYDELIWGMRYRFSLFPKILQFEYEGTYWWFDEQVPTYFSPDKFGFNTFRLSWRHYLNNDQYIEQKQLYYELGLTGSVDCEGVFGGGYDVQAGWDICHHLGVEAKWSQYFSSVYDADILYIQLVMRF